MALERFSEVVCKEIGIYVYRLIDPRNGETFYVGKGKGNRVFDHVKYEGKGKKNNLKLEKDEDDNSVKSSRIKDIRDLGLDVIHVIHRHGLVDNKTALEVEAALIDAYPELSNAAGGHGSGDRGSMHAEAIIRKYGLPEINEYPPHKLLLININKIETLVPSDLVKQQVQYAWRIDPKRADQADYVLAVARGVVLGAYKVKEKWKPATRENFPDRPSVWPGRYGFSADKASDDIWEHYVGKRGKRIALDELRHGRGNPILYWPR